MPSVLVHAPDEPVILASQAVKRLLDRGDGDAALLYLALLRRRGDAPPRSLAGELRWDRGRIEAAEAALLGLPREDVLRAWGEPDGCLSGLFGDIYTLESGARITVYYDTEPMGQGTADGQTVPVERVLISESD